jgi:hypothetical protein
LFVLSFVSHLCAVYDQLFKQRTQAMLVVYAAFEMNGVGVPPQALIVCQVVRKEFTHSSFGQCVVDPFFIYCI